MQARTWSETSAGFIALPEGTIQPDPSGTSVVAIRGRAFYDRALGRWVPARRNDISPDGRQYVYTVFENNVPTAVHLVDAVTPSDRVLVSGPWAPLDFGTDGIYLAYAERSSGAYGGEGYTQRGVYRVGTAGGTPVKLTDVSMPDFSLGAGSGWGLGAEPGDLLGLRRVLRLDLQSGSTETWMEVDRPVALSNMALDQRGYPLVWRQTGGGADLIAVSTRGAPVTLLHSDTGNPRPDAGFAVDAHGTWLSTFSNAEPFSASPWFVSPRGTVFELPSVTPRSVEVAGGCQ